MGEGQTGDRYSKLTASVKITNKGPDHVFLLLVGPPSAVDNGVITLNKGTLVTGVAYCAGTQYPSSKLVCRGKPMDQKYLFPMQGYTEMSPSAEIAWRASQLNSSSFT